jgi:hypothetical protein
MSDWANDADSDEDIPNTDHEILQDELLSKSENSRGGAPRRENRDRQGSELSQGSHGSRGPRQSSGPHRDRRKENEGERRYQGNHRDGGDRSNRSSGNQDPESIPDTGPFEASVGNLNYATEAATLGELFQSNDCNVDGVEMAVDDQGRRRGFATVSFEDKDSLVRALQGNGTELEGRVIKVQINRRKGWNNRKTGGDRRDGDRHDRDRNIRPEMEGSWDRGANLHNKRPPRGKGESEEGTSTSDASKARPQLKLQPRTKPVEASTGEAPRASSIFGDAKPRDESAYEQARNASGKKDGDSPRPKFDKKKDAKAPNGNGKKKDAPIKKTGAKKEDEAAFKKAQQDFIKSQEAPTVKSAATSNVFAGLMGDDSDSD